MGKVWHACDTQMELLRGQWACVCGRGESKAWHRVALRGGGNHEGYHLERSVPGTEPGFWFRKARPGSASWASLLMGCGKE